MIKVIVMVKRNPSLSPAEFHRHWRKVHARLVADTPSVAGGRGHVAMAGTLARRTQSLVRNSLHTQLG